MLDRLKALFAGGRRGEAGAAGRERPDELHLAAAALLVEAAGVDGRFDDAERAAMRPALEQGFGLDAAAADALIKEASEAVANTTQLYGFARVIKDRLPVDQRVRIIEMLWSVAYADGDLHDYEANLVRRVAGLLYVSDRDSGAARKRVLERLAAAGGPNR